MDDFAADVIDLLDALHIEDAVIGGLSMGGYATFALFRHAPRYFRGIVLADTRPQADTPEAVEGRKRLLAVVRQKGAAAVADEMLPKLLGETTRRERPDIVAHVGDLIRSNSADAIAEPSPRSCLARLDVDPPDIHCPAHHGRRRDTLTRALSQTCSERLAGRVVVVPAPSFIQHRAAGSVSTRARAILEHRV